MKAERRKRLEEEEKKFSELKPAQALFERAKSARARCNDDPHAAGGASSDLTRVTSRGAVEDVKKKLNRKSRNLEQELMELLEAEKCRQMDEVRKKEEAEAVQVYTKGACASLKSAFEDHIAAKKAASQVQELPTPMTRRRSVVRQRSSNLPNMFQQQEKREQAGAFISNNNF